MWLASGATDMRRGFNGLALLVQEVLKRNPHCGHLFVFRGKRGGLIKVQWHDGQGMCLLAKRLEQGRDQALIAHLKLQIEKLRREKFGPRSERSARLLEQLELQLEELESSATEDELAAEKAVSDAVRAAAQTTTVAAFTRRWPSRKPFLEHLPRERVIVPGPAACAYCGGTRLARLGEDITETLKVIPSPVEGDPARRFA